MDGTQTPMAGTPPTADATAGLIEKLTVILESARRGEITSFAAVTFTRTGVIDEWSFLTRREDHARVRDALDALKQLHPEAEEAELT